MAKITREIIDKARPHIIEGLCGILNSWIAASEIEDLMGEECDNALDSMMDFVSDYEGDPKDITDKDIITILQKSPGEHICEDCKRREAEERRQAEEEDGPTSPSDS